MKNFISVKDVTDVNALLQKALEIKRNPFANNELGKNKTLGLIFFNSSLRTRLSTQKAAINLGLSTMVFNIGEEGWKIETEEGVVMNGDKAEHIKDAAAVMGQYCDIMGIRSFATLQNRDDDYRDKIINQFIQYAGCPIISLESAILHPCQSFADLITITEHKKVNRPKVVLTWAPHPRALPQAVSNSFVEWMKMADVDLVVTNPEGYDLAPQFIDGVTVEHNQNKAFEGADFIYAKNWSSYEQYGKILSQDSSWTVTKEKMNLTNNGKFMHCLPVRRNVIVTDEVIDGPNSLIIEQANNRVFSAQTVLQEMLKKL